MELVAQVCPEVQDLCDCSLNLFLYCLSGFDLCEVGQEEVVLKTGKQASRRIMHYALQSLLALFGENNVFISDVNLAESIRSFPA